MMMCYVCERLWVLYMLDVKLGTQKMNFHTIKIRKKKKKNQKNQKKIKKIKKKKEKPKKIPILTSPRTINIMRSSIRFSLIISMLLLLFM
jgi:hypothetical protein